MPDNEFSNESTKALNIWAMDENYDLWMNTAEDILKTYGDESEVILSERLKQFYENNKPPYDIRYVKWQEIADAILTGVKRYR